MDAEVAKTLRAGSEVLFSNIRGAGHLNAAVVDSNYRGPVKLIGRPEVVRHGVDYNPIEIVYFTFVCPVRNEARQLDARYFMQ